MAVSLEPIRDITKFPSFLRWADAKELRATMPKMGIFAFGYKKRERQWFQNNKEKILNEIFNPLSETEKELIEILLKEGKDGVRALENDGHRGILALLSVWEYIHSVRLPDGSYVYFTDDEDGLKELLER